MTPAERILFRDERVIVLDKPAGIPVHAGPRAKASIEDWFPALRFGRRDGPFLCHRLDADTGGCLVLARRKSALRAVNALFAAGRVAKTYWAVVGRAPAAESGTVDAPLLKQSGKDGWRMAIDPRGLAATTDWRLRGRAEGLAWLELNPRTGRTHQVRAHAALALGAPVLGDGVYGGGQGKLMLLARAIVVPLDPPVSAIAPVPEHMRAALSACGWNAP